MPNLQRPATILFVVLLLAQTVCGAAPTPVTTWPASAPGFDPTTVNAYVVHPGKDDMRLFWRDTTGRDFRTAPALEKSLAEKGTRLVLAMNSGLYRDDEGSLSPVGLHIEGGQELVPLDPLESGKGNFYLQPNGVLWWGGGSAGIVTTQAYAEAKLSPEYALQSGPMLVVNGALNPTIEDARKSKYTRAGVGITPDGNLVLAFAPSRLSLYEFGVVFRDQLKCTNALYLDGAIVSLYSPEANVRHSHGPMAGIIAIVDSSAK